MTYPEFIALWHDDSARIECHTSGSTGTPKRIFLPKSEVKKSALRTIRHFNLDTKSIFYSCISPDFIGGKMQAVRACVLSERTECCVVPDTLIWETPSNRPLSNGNLPERIDLLSVVPSQMIYLLDNIDKLPDIKHILIGGAPIPDALRKRISESALDAWETYGMTETASHIALRKITYPPTPFIPLEGVSISTDADSRLVIEIDGWQKLTTNDIVNISRKGFEILGRADNVIISGGKKIHPEQVEKILEADLGEEVMVSWEEDLKWGEKVTLIIESCKLDDAEILNRCRTLLPAEAVPKKIIRSPIPRTENGKKKRRSAPCQTPTPLQ